MRGKWALGAAILSILCAAGPTRAESVKEYENRVTAMIEITVRLDDQARRHLGDLGLLSYTHAVAETNVTEASRLAPPPSYANLHPHFVIVLENVERALFFASRGDMARYRKHNKTLRKEIGILESLAERAGLTFYAWDLMR
ncbi:MAG: hypothetical protein MUC50_11170 [Myxococcota bacterium]|jgi:hypothetical protein|nr:hypothetical protein [Myxococcota bacterium]